MEEIETEIKELPQLENLIIVKRAVKEGVKEANEEIINEVEKKAVFFEEIINDDF